MDERISISDKKKIKLRSVWSSVSQCRYAIVNFVAIFGQALGQRLQTEATGASLLLAAGVRAHRNWVRGHWETEKNQKETETETETAVCLLSTADMKLPFPLSLSSKKELKLFFSKHLKN